mmetsp:Transcript_74908/g.217425  ORF Transcript_74908/g.217425 Transcript_74908/m.217425 type:complete len:1270 (+) Transcript_74908:2-3811(+)
MDEPMRGSALTAASWGAPMTPGPDARRTTLGRAPTLRSRYGIHCRQRGGAGRHRAQPRHWSDSGADGLDKETEKEWKIAAKKSEIKTGCRTLLFFSLCLVVKTMRDLYFHYDVPGCSAPSLEPMLWSYTGISILFLIVQGWLLYQAFEQMTLRAYLPVVFSWYVMVFLTGFPPCALDCMRLGEIIYEDHQRVLNNACNSLGNYPVITIRNANCTLNSVNYLHILMTFILTSYRFLPCLRMMWWNWVYIFGFYLPVNIIEWNWFQPYYQDCDIFVSVCLLSACQLIATTRKYYIEKSTRNRLISNIKENKGTKKIFSILRFMVPPHVIKRMLLKPEEHIADPIDRVSILFIIISDFEYRTRDMRPADLLRFLNHTFEAWDEICAHHKVSKIETVAEEYVCAVGVVPADIEIDKTQGHSVLLERLVRVAVEILAQSSEANVKVKMGLHTGPIVAGVIGQKLPRFRLFGDTINTAARMMQKGLDGKLQFGRETMEVMPKGSTASVRGEIEMKGKGKVTVYLLRTEDPIGRSIYASDLQRVKPRPQSHNWRKRKSVVDHILINTTNSDSGEIDDTHPAVSEPAAASAPMAPAIAAVEAAAGGSQIPVRRRAAKERGVGRSVTFATAVEYPEPEVVSASSEGGGRVPEVEREDEGDRTNGKDRWPYEESDTDSTDSDASDAPFRGSSIAFGSDEQAAEAAPQSAEDLQQQKEFEDVLRALAKARDTQQDGWRKFVSGGLRTNFFTDELNKEWAMWHHHNQMCHKLHARVNRHIVGLFMVTALDSVVFVMCAHFWRVQFWPHAVYGMEPLRGMMGTYGLMRLPVFLACRIACYIMLTWWLKQAVAGFRRSLASSVNKDRDGWIPVERTKARLLLLLTYCIIAVLIFVSYDAVSNIREDWVMDLLREKGDMVSLDDWLASFKEGLEAHKGRRTSTNTFCFFIVFYMIATEHPFSFLESLAFFIVCTGLLAVARSSIWDDERGRTLFPLYWSTTAMLNFQIVNVLNVFSAWGLEWNSRARFKAMKTLDKTRTRANLILRKLVPPLVIEDIRNLPARAPPPSHEYRHATIAQSDLCGFTQLSADKRPHEVVKFMSDLFGRFDALSDKRGIWKVETVGDAYIAGQAEIPLTLHRSPLSVVLFGQDMVRAVNEWSSANGFSVKCRVGVHHGKCVGGIVGTTSQRYHLFGDLIRILDVLEATGREGGVQISQACAREVQREIREVAPPEAEEILDFEPYRGPHLQTSKGEVHTFEEVEGKPFRVIFRDRDEIVLEDGFQLW